MRGLIAAAGRGTRFLPAVKVYPKELAPVLEKANIQLLVEELIGTGITEIGIVIRPDNDLLKKYFTPDPILNAYLKKTGKEQYLESLNQLTKKIKKLEFIIQTSEFPYGTASPILAARNFIAGDTFVYIQGDDLIIEERPGDFIRLLIDYYNKYQPAVVLSAQEVSWDEIDRYGSIEYLKNADIPYRCGAVLEKLPPDQAPSNKASFGRFVVSQKIYEVLSKQKLSRDNELWFADALNTLAKEEIAIAVPIEKGKWMTTGDPLRWLQANIELALKKEEYAESLKKYLSSLVF